MWRMALGSWKRLDEAFGMLIVFMRLHTIWFEAITSTFSWEIREIRVFFQWSSVCLQGYTLCRKHDVSNGEPNHYSNTLPRFNSKDHCLWVSANFLCQSSILLLSCRNHIASSASNSNTMLSLFSSFTLALSWISATQGTFRMRQHRYAGTTSFRSPHGEIPGGSPLKFCNESRSTDLYSIDQIELYPNPLYM